MVVNTICLNQYTGIINAMSLQVAGHQTEGYRVATTIYEGPLDLLLELIEHAELDITTLAIAQVTDQYLIYLKDLQDRDPAEVSAFLVMAARLLQIKSAALLPRPEAVEHVGEEEDDAEALARQLIEYRRFKQIANLLSKREEEGLRSYLRLSPAQIKVDARLDMTGIGLADLIDAARQAFGSTANLTNLSSVVSMPRITIREKIESILSVLKRKTNASFRGLLRSRNRVEVVVTFLALLELIKRRVVEAHQDGLFADIEFDSIGEWQENGSIEIDFSE